VCADEAANDEERGAEELIALLVFNKRQPADRKDDVPLVMTVLDCPRVLLPKSPDVSEQEASESLANAAMTAAQGPGDGVLQGAELAEVLALQQSSQPGIIEPAVFSEFVKEDGLKVVVKDSPESDDGSLSTAEQLSHNVMTVSETEAGLEQQGEDEQFGLEHDGAQTFESDLESSDAPKLGDVNPLSFEPVGHAEVGAAKPELVEPEVITRQIVAEVENAVRNAAETGSIRLEMSLEPKELGKLVIALSMENGRVAMLRIQAENSQTRVLLERYAAGLEKKFEGSTVKIETLDANSFESGHAKDAMGSGQKDNLDEQKQRQRTILMERRVEEFALSC
jgi:flagellar hook-length control protein FliK